MKSNVSALEQILFRGCGTPVQSSVRWSGLHKMSESMEERDRGAQSRWWRPTPGGGTPTTTPVTAVDIVRGDTAQRPSIEISSCLVDHSRSCTPPLHVLMRIC